MDDMTPVDGAEMIANMNNYPQEKLAPLLGQYVAWSLDGKEILANAWTLEDLYAEMDRRGRRDFIYDYLPAAWDVTGRPVLNPYDLARANSTAAAPVPDIENGESRR